MIFFPIIKRVGNWFRIITIENNKKINSYVVKHLICLESHFVLKQGFIPVLCS